MFLMSWLSVTCVQVSSELLVVTLALGRKPRGSTSCVHMFIFVLKGIYLEKQGRGDLCICQQDTEWGAQLPLPQPQSNMSCWEASVLPCWSRLPSPRTAVGSSTAAENTASHEKGLFPSVRNSENETAGLKLVGAAHSDGYANMLITAGEVAMEPLWFPAGTTSW